MVYNLFKVDSNILLDDYQMIHSRVSFKFIFHSSARKRVVFFINGKTFDLFRSILKLNFPVEQQDYKNSAKLFKRVFFVRRDPVGQRRRRIYFQSVSSWIYDYIKRDFCQFKYNCKTDTLSIVIALTSHSSGHYATTPR